MANYVKFKQGLKKDFNTTNQPLTNGMIYFVIDENNNGSIYYDTIVDGKKATKNGTVHRVKFSGLPIKVTGSVIGTGVISKDGETIEINTSTNHSHGLAHQDFTVTLSNDDTNLKWTRLGNQNGEGFWLKSVRGNVKAPVWFQPNNGAGVAFGGGSTKGIISVKYDEPSVRFAGGNGDAPVWYFTITGANNKSYDLSKIGGHSSDSAKLDHNVTFKIASTADATKGGNGTTTNLSGAAVDLYLPSNLSGFDNIQSTRFQGTADNADTVDYFHMAEEKYKYETTQKQPTAGADWCIKISTPVWNSTSETIYLSADGDNTHGTVILKTGSRQNNWWGYATNYNGTGIIGVYKLVSDSDDVYIKVNGAYTSVRIRTTFNPTISIPTTIPDYKFTSVPWQGGFFSNAIYTDTLTFTAPKYWANIPISDSLKTDTQPTFNTAYVSNWWRSTGNTGWWNETHLGGITMEDKTYVKVAGNKSFLIPNGSLKIGGDGDIFFATGSNNATLKIYGQTNTEYGIETIAIQTCFNNQDPQISTYTTQYANRCNLLLQPRGGQVYIGKNLTAVGDTGYKLLVDGNQWTSGSQWVNGNLLFTDITGNTVDTGMSLKGIYGRIGGNNGWRIAGGARANNVGYFEIATCDDMNEPIYVRQYGGGGDWNGYVSLARTFTLLDAAGRSRAPELFEAKKVHVNSLLDQSVAIADIGYQFQVTGTSNFTDSVDISGVTTHHNHIQIDANYSISKPGKSSTWFSSHNNAMIRMTSSVNWSPLLAQKVTNGYWILGHYDYYNKKDEKDKNSDFRNQWVFGYLSDSNLEGTTGASNSLTTTYRLLNIGGNNNQRMFVSAIYNAAVGSGTQPVYVQSNGNVAACSYGLSATIEAGTANRMAYYKAANQIGSSDHYVTSNQVGINTNTTYDFTFYVGGNSYFSNLVTVYAGNNLGVKIGQTNITAIDGSLIFQNNTALRFGSSEWNWDKWAGLKYVPSSKTIVMGLADSTNFVANSVQSGGTFLFTGMTSIDLNKTASIKNLAIGGGIYWNPYVESATDGSDAASITVIKSGVANGTELRIQQQNDADDVINLVVNNSIFLNSKRAFRIHDGWLRINEDSSFNYGIYTGTSLVRSDNQLQVGDSGNAFYANSAGNGYLSNNLIIRGKYAVNFFGSGDQTYTQSAFIINNTDGFVLETPRSANEITATNILPFKIRTRGGQPAPEYAGDRLIETDCTYNLGSTTAEFAKGFMRAIATRHLDADAVLSVDHTLYIGYGNAAYTDKTAFFYSSSLSSRTQFAEINSNGLYALTRFGVNGQNTGYTCYINGTLFSGTHTVYGRADSNTAPSSFYYNGALEIRESNLVANSASANSFNYAPRIGFHWANRAAASLSFNNDGIFYFRKQDGSSRATIDANVNGTATNANHVWNDSAYMSFHWDGSKGTQPTWLWGGNEAGNMYVYNPSNFSVNYANSAKNADMVDNYHASSFFIQDRLANTSIAGDDGLWGVTGNRSFHGALPEGLSNIYNWGQLISFSTDNAARFQIYAAHMGSVDSTLSYRTGWGTDKKVWRTFIDSGNIGKQSVNYAASAGNADTVDGYHAADLFSGGYKTTVDLSSLNNNLYYPVTGASIPANGYHKIKISVHLNSGTKPSWATHSGGFTTNVELYTTAYGWGTTQGETIILNDSYSFTNCGQVVGFTQNGNNSVPVLWLKGGGKYFVECDYNASWTVRTSLYYTYGSASDRYKQTVEPQSSYPGFKAGNGGAINGTIRAGQVYGAVWNDYAEYRQTKEYVQPGYCVIETGKGDLIKSSKRLQPGANIVSDTFGFAIGETEQTKTPLAVSGRVLAYPYEDRDSYQAGDSVCSGPNGTISKMTREEVREYPDRIIGTVSEIPNYEIWGTGNVKVNNRIWIKVK